MYAYNGIGVIVVVESVFSDGVAIDVADELDVSGPRIDGVKVKQRAIDERIRRSLGTLVPIPSIPFQNLKN